VNDLPKIARTRLAAQEPPSGLDPSTSSGVTHLDGNLMAAFVEHSLLPAERSTVLEHLARCSECRAEVRLVQRASVGDPDAGLTAADASSIAQPWWRWTLRWESATAGAAAVLALAALWVSTHPTARQEPNAMAVMARNVAPPPAPAPRPETLRAPLGRSPAAPPAPSRVEGQALSRTGAARKPSDAELLKMKTEALTAIIVPSGSAPEQARPAGTAGLAPTASMAAASASLASARQSADTLVVTKPSTQSKAPQEIDIENRATATPSPSAPAKTVSAHRLMGVHPAAMSLVVRWAASEAAGPGTVEKSLDGGRTWQSVMVATGVQLRAVFALGEDVWAGGAGGSLFHSSDGGQHWSAISVSSAGATLSSDIVSIQFADPAHGSVAASNGERWITVDGGKHWNKVE